MIVGIDHLVLLCPEINGSIATLQALLGRRADWRSVDHAGAASALFQFEHIALELLAPCGDGPLAERLHELLRERGPGLQTLVLSSDDIAGDQKIFRRRGLAPSVVETGSSTDELSGRQRHWQRMRLDDAVTGGIRTFVLQRSNDDPLVRAEATPDAVHGLDYLVMATSEPVRALAHYGAKLGLELRSDRSDPTAQVRLMVLQVGASGIEIVQRAQGADAQHGDRLWGLTWRTLDIEAAHARLCAAGLDVSEVRAGRRPGTRVFTVRTQTLGVPTLVVQNPTP